MESESEWQLQPDPLTHWTGPGIKPAPEPLQSILNPEPQQEPLVVGGLTCIQPGIFCGVFLVHINTAKIYHWEVVETLSNCTRGKEAGDRHFCASKGYFFFYLWGKAHDNCFLYSLERRVDQKFTVCLFAVFSCWTLPCKGGCKSEKKSSKRVRLTIPCLTLSGHLEELQLLTYGRELCGKPQEEKQVFAVDCSLHSRKPLDSLGTWMGRQELALES